MKTPDVLLSAKSTRLVQSVRVDPSLCAARLELTHVSRHGHHRASRRCGPLALPAAARGKGGAGPGACEVGSLSVGYNALRMHDARCGGTDGVQNYTW